jgi:hypothetical protein
MSYHPARTPCLLDDAIGKAIHGDLVSSLYSAKLVEGWRYKEIQEP